MLRNQMTLDKKSINLLSHKNLNPTLFQDLLDYSAPINEHAAWTFRHIYSQPYSKAKDNTQTIVRYYHGMQHISRVAIYIPIFVHLYKKYQDKEADLLTQDDIKLLQIAAIFHDAAREKEGKDLWDDESATMVYLYLYGIGVSQEKAILLAEAVANKDEHDDGYHQFYLNEGEISWKCNNKRPKNIYPKNIYQKIIHDADCLDIIRVRDHFEADYLDFFKTIACSNTFAFQEQSQLITEARSFIANQGDSYQLPQADIKLLYEDEDGFNKIVTLLSNKNYMIMPALYHDGILLNQLTLSKSLLPKLIFAESNGWTENNVKAAMYEGKLLARGIDLPSAINDKLLTFSDGSTTQESKAHVENRKLSRRLGIPTTTSKDNKLQKQGNPDRSCSMPAYGAGLFANAGYFLFTQLDRITSISPTNINSGFHKKPLFKPPVLTRQKKIKKLKKLLHHLQMGGSSTAYNGFASTHNEITYNMDNNIGAIYFTNDPTAGNIVNRHQAQPAHEYSSILQAIYLRKEYENTYGITLPIFEYSGLHHFVRRVSDDEYSEEKILAMWIRMCSDYMKAQLTDLDSLTSFSKESIHDIKVKAMYGTNLSMNFPKTKKFYAGDNNYSTEYQDKISKAIEKEKDRLLEEKGTLTHLLFFIVIGDIENVKKLISLNDEKFITSEEANPYITIMEAAIANGQTEIVKLLINTFTSDKTIFAKSALDGRNPLHYSVLHGRLDIFNLLVEAGADVNAVDNYDCNAFHFAIKNNQMDIVKTLLNTKIDITRANKAGKTPLLLAIEEHQLEMVELLLNQGVEVNIIYTLTSSTRLLEIISFIRKEKISAALITPLHWAAYWGNDEIVKKLIAKGAIVADSPQGISPYMLTLSQKVRAILMIYQPTEVKKVIQEGSSYYLKHLTAEDEIEKIIENKEVIQAILSDKNTEVVVHLIKEYFKKKEMIINAHNGEINFLHFTNPIFKDWILTRKITDYQIDLTNPSTMKGLIKMIRNKEFDLFTLLLKNLKDDPNNSTSLALLIPDIIDLKNSLHNISFFSGKSQDTNKNCQEVNLFPDSTQCIKPT